MFSYYINKVLLFFILLFFLSCSTKRFIDKKNSDLPTHSSVIIKENDALTTDSDGDGVVDKFDLEKNTPKGILVDDSGRSLDLDNDGVPDYIDDDPFSTLGSFVDKNGRELDDDRDGVPNNIDLEINTKNGSCVNTKGESINCLDAVLPIIYFMPNSSQVEDFNLDRIQVISSILRNNSGYKVRLKGFFDFNGLESYNIKLDEKRANAVIQILVNIFGVDLNRMVIDTDKLIEENNNNGILRKVEFELY